MSWYQRSRLSGRDQPQSVAEEVAVDIGPGRHLSLGDGAESGLRPAGTSMACGHAGSPSHTRKLAVLSLMAAGLMAKSIGRRLAISES
jgi:hypothetical protein